MLKGCTAPRWVVQPAVQYISIFLDHHGPRPSGPSFLPCRLASHVRPCDRPSAGMTWTHSSARLPHSACRPLTPPPPRTDTGARTVIPHTPQHSPPPGLSVRRRRNACRWGQPLPPPTKPHGASVLASMQARNACRWGAPLPPPAKAHHGDAVASRALISPAISMGLFCPLCTSLPVAPRLKTHQTPNSSLLGQTHLHYSANCSSSSYKSCDRRNSCNSRNSRRSWGQRGRICRGRRGCRRRIVICSRRSRARVPLPSDSSSRYNGTATS